MKSRSAPQGFALPGTLIVCAFSLALTAAALWEIQRTLKLRSIRQQAGGDYEEAVLNALGGPWNKGMNRTPADPLLDDSPLFTVARGEAPDDRQKLIGSQAGLLIPNLSPLALTFDECSSKSAVTRPRTLLGVPTTSTASIAPYRCRLGSITAGHQGFSENLEIDRVILPPLERAPVLFADGYVSITTVTVSNSGVILAGGDLFIDAVDAAKTQGSKLMLVSLTGKVLVKRVRGAVSIKAYGWRDAQVPATPFLPPYPELDRRTRLIIGSSQSWRVQ